MSNGDSDLNLHESVSEYEPDSESEPLTIPNQAESSQKPYRGHRKGNNSSVKVVSSFTSHGQSGSIKPQSDRLIPEIAENPFASEPSYFVRPNRYFGPPSTWNSWTAEERLTALALDRIRSQNLSIHLFNASVIRKRRHIRNVKRQRDVKGKGKASNGEEEQHQGRNTILSKSWVAWPLPPEIVPLAESSEITDKRPSAELEACLLATTTRIARERWHGREWCSDSESNEETDFAGQNTSVKEPQPKDDIHDRGHHANNEGRIPVDEASGRETGSPSSSDSSVDNTLFRSQDYDISLEDTVESADMHKQKTENRPTMLADDEIAAQILLPSIRHILSRFDDLLHGLHQARQAYSVVCVDDTSEGTSTDTSAERSRGRGRSAKAKPTSRVAGSRTRSSSFASTMSGASRNRRQRQRAEDQFGLRDWSEVLGIASLTGWNHKVIERASERCALLFNQNMMFRTFYETKGTTRQPSAYKEYLAFDTENVSDSQTPEHL